MVLEYFGRKVNVADLRKAVNSETSGYTWTIGVAKAAAEFGFKTEFYTSYLGVNPENFDLELYKKEVSAQESAKVLLGTIINSCKKYNVVMQQKTFHLNEILSKINQNCVAIVLLDWSVITNKSEYQGHIVPIVGYDEKNVYVHQPGYPPSPFFAISRELFDKARLSKGTDQDVVFIHRK
jgi:hypothetical protein